MSLRKPFLFSSVIVAAIALFFLLRPQKKEIVYSEWAPIVGEIKTAHEIPEAERAKSACFQTYSRLYSKPDLHVAVIFGYKDARPARFVGDRYERLMLIEQLLQSCPDDRSLCGFTRDEDDAETFHKTIKGLDKKSRKIVLQVMASAVSPDDDENKKDPFQLWQSERTSKNFIAAIQKADVVLYNGHSRDGGGPDFAPPKLANRNHVSYSWYQSKRPGVALLEQGLKEKSYRASLLGLFSCVSENHFERILSTERTRLATITQKNLVYYAEALRQVTGTLTALLGMWCEPGFQSAIQAESKGGTASLKGFFKN